MLVHELRAVISPRTSEVKLKLGLISSEENRAWVLKNSASQKLRTNPGIEIVQTIRESIAFSKQPGLGAIKHLRPIIAPVADGRVSRLYNHLVCVVGMEKVERRRGSPPLSSMLASGHSRAGAG